MPNWLRGCAFSLCALGALSLALAQAPVDPKRAQAEKEAMELFQRGDAKMKVALYEEAIDEFTKVLNRYPDTDARYQAQFRMADALVALKKETEALRLLEAVVKEESPEWSPQALFGIGEMYIARQKYSDAFQAFRQVISEYPDSPMVDHAYFAIGKTHFQLGHFELAAEELDKVGTAYASCVPELQRVSPGDPVYVRLTEPNTVAAADARLTVTVSAKSGDKLEVSLAPEVEGSDRFIAAVPTELGEPNLKDDILQLHGNDTVTLTYKSRYVGTEAETKTVLMTTASSGRLLLLQKFDNSEAETAGIAVNQEVIVEVRDPDRDASADKDTIIVLIKTKGNDSEKLTLTETGVHTGVFRGVITLKRGEPKADSGVLETNAGTAEGSDLQLDDSAAFTYMDELHLFINIKGPHEITMEAPFFRADDGRVVPPNVQVQSAEMEINKLLYEGRSLTEIAATYRDLGQGAKAYLNFRRAEEQFKTLIARYPNSPAVEDAMFGLYQNYVAQENYAAAINVISDITRRFPNSARASEALFELASLHVKRREYDRALNIFQRLVVSARGTPLAEEAQYAICATYLAMMKPEPGMSVLKRGADVTPEQVSFALEEFVRQFPNSERAPEALWQMVQLREEGADYRGVIDGARRMATLYPENVMTGRVMLMKGKSQFKLRDFDGAEETFRYIIANYGDQATDAKRFLDQVLDMKKKLAPTTPAAAPAARGR